MNCIKLIFLLFFFYVFGFSSFSQTIEFFNPSGGKIGKISYDDTPKMECGNCGALFDRFGNKVCEVSPIGGYRQFKGASGIFCEWTLDYKVFEGSILKGYAKEDWNGKYRFLKLFSKEGKQIGYTKFDSELLTKTFYSMSGKVLMTAKKWKGFGSFNGHDSDITLAYYFMFVAN
jgi:hypothetical protein